MLKKINRKRNECIIIHYQARYTYLLSCRLPVVSSYILKISTIGFALLELFCKRAQIIVPFWETAQLPLPQANIDTYLSLRAKCWLREGVSVHVPPSTRSTTPFRPNSLPVDRAFTVRGSHLSFNLPRRAGRGAAPRPLSRFDRHSHASHVEL